MQGGFRSLGSQMVSGDSINENVSLEVLGENLLPVFNICFRDLTFRFHVGTFQKYKIL